MEYERTAPRVLDHLTQPQWLKIGTLRANGASWETISKATHLPEEELCLLPINNKLTYRRWLATAQEIVDDEALGEAMHSLRTTLRGDNDRLKVQAANSLARLHACRHPVPKPKKEDLPKPMTPREEQFHKDADFYSRMTLEKYEEFKMVQTRHEFLGIASTLLHDHPELEETFLTTLKLSTMGHADGFALETKEREAYQEHLDNVFKGKVRVPEFFPHTAAKQYAASEARQAAIDGLPPPPTPPPNIPKKSSVLALPILLLSWLAASLLGGAPVSTANDKGRPTVAEVVQHVADPEGPRKRSGDVLEPRLARVSTRAGEGDVRGQQLQPLAERLRVFQFVLDVADPRRQADHAFDKTLFVGIGDASLEHHGCTRDFDADTPRRGELRRSEDDPLQIGLQSGHLNRLHGKPEFRRVAQARRALLVGVAVGLAPKAPTGPTGGRSATATEATGGTPPRATSRRAPERGLTEAPPARHARGRTGSAKVHRVGVIPRKEVGRADAGATGGSAARTTRSATTEAPAAKATATQTATTTEAPAAKTTTTEAATAPAAKTTTTEAATATAAETATAARAPPKAATATLGEDARGRTENEEGRQYPETSTHA